MVLALRRKFGLLWWLLVGYLNLIVCTGFADTLSVGFVSQWPPYTSDRLKPGLEVEIVSAALANEGHSIEVFLLPMRRLQKAVETMGLDAAATVVQDIDGNHYSSQYIDYQVVAVTKAASGISIKQVTDLREMRVLAWQSAFRQLGPEFFQMFRPSSPAAKSKRYTEHGAPELMAIFWRQKNAVAILDRTVFDWYRKEMAERYTTGAKVQYHRVFQAVPVYRVAFKNRRHRDEFEKGLSELRRSGEYKKLVVKYLGAGM